MANGKIVRMVRDRGFGFIRTDEGGDIFFHRTATEVPFEQLNEGESVSFDVEADPRGRGNRAVHVRPAA